ncbi:MAG: hypothetical protein KNN13_04650 [Hydrogenobacter thermophilus]|uniref:hypothetical protein n=1 Tax=Hydrogenobacter thermophilus TaxID=940 RepID=UPI001C7989BA|nr:hypothetical protein [Hydrogenobacter thermophilus]QWK20611.1 MAG: hypothetical protein KNN13_04650 [Hydrogenobacter thermophilus]
MKVELTSEILEKLRKLPFVKDIEILPELPEDVDAQLGIRIKLSEDAEKYPAGKIIAELINEISWEEFEQSGRYPSIYWEVE